jgi:hypothetical protein
MSGSLKSQSLNTIIPMSFEKICEIEDAIRIHLDIYFEKEQPK